MVIPMTAPKTMTMIVPTTVMMTRPMMTIMPMTIMTMKAGMRAMVTKPICYFHSLVLQLGHSFTCSKGFLGCHLYPHTLHTASALTLRTLDLSIL